MPWSLRMSASSRRIVAVCCALSLVAPRFAARAEEPVKPFIEALKSKGYYDVAANYVQNMQKSSALSAEQKLDYLFEHGDILMKMGLAERDPKKRDVALADAQTKLNEFLKIAGNHPSAPDALILLGNLTYTRGLALRKSAEKTPPDKREPELKAARSQLLEAKKLLDDSDQQIVGILTPISEKVKKKEELTKDEEELRDKFFPILLNIRVKVGEVLSDLALTYDPKTDAKAYQAALTDANKEYDEAYKKYFKGGYGAAFFARINQAHNTMLLGKPADAAKMAWEVFAEEGVGTNAAIYKKALRVALEASLVEGKFAETWPKIEDAMQDVPRVVTAQDAEITYFAALNAEKAITALTKPADKDKAKAAAVNYVKGLLRFKSPFDYYAPARDLAKRLNVKVAEKGKGNYEELLLESKQTFRSYYEAYQKWSDFQGPDDEKKVLQNERDALHDSVFDVMTDTLAVAPRDAVPDDLILLRYVISGYYSQHKSYYEAVVYGETAAQKSTSDMAGKAAGIVIKSLQEIRSELLKFKNSDKPKPTEAQLVVLNRELAGMNRKIRGASKHLITSWPTTSEADSARLILLTSELEDSNFAAAKKIVETINPKSPLRGTAGLILGTVAAQKYYNAKFGSEKTDETVQAAEAFKKYAVDDLKAALLKGAETKLDERAVMGAYLFLITQLKEGTIDPTSLKIIDHPKTGLFAMIAGDSEDIPEKSSFDISRIVFQTYLQAGKLDSAVKMIDLLEKQAGDDAEQKKLVNAIIMSAGAELKTRIKELREKGDLKKSAELAAAHASLLDKLAQRSDTLEFPAMYGISDAYTGLADGDPDHAADYLKKAETIYGKITARAQKNPDFVNVNTLQLIRVKQIGLMRSRGDFEGAYGQLKTILREKPTFIQAQKEAALTLELWGDSEKAGSKSRFDRYAKACSGEAEGEKPVIWGWTKMWNTLYRDAMFNYQGNPEDKKDAVNAARRNNVREQFFEARFNLANIRMKMAGEKGESDPVRLQLLNAAKSIVKQSFDVNVIPGVPPMGGAELRADNEKLLKKIQVALKQKPIGFQEFLDQEKQQNADTDKTVAAGK